MNLKLYDTVRRSVVDFAPDKEVLMYTCGITPYDATHIGHAFTFVSYDILQRRLIDKGHTVKCVRNVTDVDEMVTKGTWLSTESNEVVSGWGISNSLSFGVFVLSSSISMIEKF